jgi:ABC-2 type transport system permease protein
LPIGFISYYPSQLFLKSQSSSILVYISPFVGVIFFIIAYMVWLKSINSYSGTGT